MVLRFKQSCVLNLLAFFAFTVTTAVVVVRDDGYQNVLVAFSPDIIKDEQPKVLSATQDLMKLASRTVYKATGIHFGEVVLLLPYTWGKLEDLSYVDNIAYSSTNEVYYDANIFVEDSESTVYGTYPYTLQRGGCGTQGVRITIPKDFLNSNERPDDERAKIIAREWIRYRYGVFYENGYPNDDRYPLYFRRPGSDNPADIEITGCTNKPVNYTFKNSVGEECSLSADESGRPDEKSATCSFRPQESENNSQVSSSLMFLQDLPNVVYLCGDQDHIHNDAAPNKQNSLCNGRSIWTVMKEHNDFKNRQTTGGTDTPPDPKFRIVVDGNPRIVVAIDGNGNIEDYTKTIVQRATDKFIFDLPNETEFSLFVFDSNVETIWEKKSFRDGRPTVDLVFNRGETPCPSCAIKKGLEVLTDTNSGNKGTIVVFCSTDLDDESPEFSSQLKSSHICVIVILHESNNSSEKFQKVFDTSLCSHVWIMPSAEKDNALDILTQLNEELENVIMDYSYHNAMYTVETAAMNDMDPVSFRTDRSIKEFQIRLTSMQLTKLDSFFQDSDVELKNSKGEEKEKERMENFKEFRMYKVSTNMSDSWGFKIKRIDKRLRERILLQVVAKGSSSKSLRVRSWIEDTISQEGSETPEQLPVALYVGVTMGINPVLYAKVQAVINRPTEGPTEIELLDNGLGDPDVTNNDGIYSRYFTQFTSEGDYQVTIAISDSEGRSQTARPPQSGPPMPCCGSFVPSGAKDVTGPFKRVIKTNFGARSGPPPLGYKPSRVQDLRLLSWDKTILGFQWTSPGDEMDTGAAKEYIFGLFETKEDAERKFEDKIIDAFTITESLPPPKDYSSKETMKIQLNDSLATDKNYFFAIRSESKKGRQSDTSNIVQIYIPATFTSPPPTNESINTGDDGNSDDDKLQSGGVGKITIIVVSVCVVVIIIFICAYVAFYLIIVRPKRKRDESEGSPKPSRKNSRNTNACSVDETEAENERQMENKSLSPVNSWPSNVLVNHHEKVKEAKRKNERPPVFTLEELESAPDVIKTISNGLLPNPVYGSHAEDLNENPDHGTYASLSFEDNGTVRSSRRVTNV